MRIGFKNLQRILSLTAFGAVKVLNFYSNICYQYYTLLVKKGFFWPSFVALLRVTVAGTGDPNTVVTVT